MCCTPSPPLADDDALNGFMREGFSRLPVVPLPFMLNIRTALL